MDSSSSGSISSSGGGGAGITGNEEEYTSPPNDQFLNLSSFSPLNYPNNPDQYPNFLDQFSPSLDPNLPFSNFVDPFSSSLNPNTNPHDTTSPQTFLPPPMSSSISVQNPTIPTNKLLPKKRSRASRRPSTTVLTTDTSNFRNMVQEFTGFPAPSFVPTSSPFVRPRLGNDLGLLHLGMAPYLLRPFSQKIQSNPNSSIVDAIASMRNNPSSSMVDAIASMQNNTMFAAPSATSTSSSSSSTNFANASSATTSSVDPISNFSNAKYNFMTQDDIARMIGSVEPEKESEMCTKDKELPGLFNYADPKEKR